MDRREFIKTAAVAAAVLGVPRGLRLGAEQVANAQTPDIVAVRGGEPVAMLRLALDRAGGIGRFVKPGQKVVIKPNIGWDQPPEMGANTNPELVGELVRLCLAAGAAQVEVFDHTCNAWRNCYKNSGIGAAVEAAGGKMLRGDNRADYQERTVDKAISMKTALIHRAVLDAD